MENKIAYIKVSSKGMMVSILGFDGFIHDAKFFPTPENFRADAYNWAMDYPGVNGRVEVEEVQ